MVKLKELGGLVQIVKDSGSHTTDEDLLMVSCKGPNLSDASLCCCAKMQ